MNFSILENNADVSLTLKEAPFLSPWVESDTVEFQQRSLSKLKFTLLSRLPFNR